MSLIIDRAPLSVLIDGEQFKINADFRTSLLFEQMLRDPEVNEAQTVALALNLYYPKAPRNTAEAVRQLMWFYRCSEEPSAGSGMGGTAKRLYDYEQDASLIYAAFMADYQIDLEYIGFLHWWKFKVLFENLRPENAISKIMEYRGMDIGKLKGEKRSFYRKMQKIYAIKQPSRERARLDELDKLLIEGADVSQILENPSYT